MSREMHPTAVAGDLATERKRAQVATRAFLRALARWGISHAHAAAILGISPASVSRMARGRRLLDLGRKEGELALMTVRIYRSLDALVGGDDTRARLWLEAENRHLGGTPLALMQRVDGLVRVAEYLDAMRAKV